MTLKKQTAVLALAIFSAAACTQKDTPKTEMTTEAGRAADWATAQCISDEMDAMFARGELKDLNPPGKNYYSYRLEGDAYKTVVAACEKKTGQKTLYPDNKAITAHSPKMLP